MPQAPASYSYAQLEGLWIKNGGPRNVAPVAAAIALAESGGRPGALNPTDNNGTQTSVGLWQVSNGTHQYPQAWLTPAGNAQEAVAKYKGAGNSFAPWGTYTSGAYAVWLKNRVTPDLNVPGSRQSSNPTNAAPNQTNVATNCLIGVPNPVTSVASILPWVSATDICLFRKSNARALIGGLLMAVGGIAALAGGAVLVAGAFPGRTTKAMGTAAELTGGAVSLAGAPEVGAGIAAAGHGARSAGKHAQQKGRQRKARKQAEFSSFQKSVGEPRENQNLRTDGGTVRQETSAQRARRYTRSNSNGHKEEVPF